MATFKHLTKVEVEELRDFYQMDNTAIGKLDKRLNPWKDEEKTIRRAWHFESEASFFRISLMAELDRMTPGGKTFPGKTQNVQFKPKFGMRGFGQFRTPIQEIAKGVYLSDAFRAGQCWDAAEKVMAEEEKAYQDFKKKIVADPAKLERLRNDIAVSEAAENPVQPGGAA